MASPLAPPTGGAALTRVLLFAGAYMTADLSLEAAAGEKKLWHCMLASALAGTVYGIAARTVMAGTAIGFGVGAASAPGYYYLYMHRREPSLLAYIAPKWAAGARQGGIAGRDGAAPSVTGDSSGDDTLAPPSNPVADARAAGSTQLK
jgi:hypothetical protein